MAGWMFGSSTSVAPSQQRPSSMAEQVKPAEQEEPDLYSRTQDVAKAYTDYSKMFTPEVVRGREVQGDSAPAPMRMPGYNAVPLPKGKRLLTSDDYANLVLDALKLEAQSRVTRMSAPNISGLLG
jgi:hypothetical protein